MILPRAAIETLIPHKGAMCLWDEVLAWDSGRIHLRTDSHRDPANPLRADGRLHAVHLCEYGAQAMAVHGGLLAKAAGDDAEPGLLVALRGVDLRVARIDDLPAPLECVSEPVAVSETSRQYAFRILCDGVLIADGRAMVASPAG